MSDEESLLAIYEDIKLNTNIPIALIQDEGRTEFDKPTYTCFGVGPDWSIDIDIYTGHLRLYKDR